MSLQVGIGAPSPQRVGRRSRLGISYGTGNDTPFGNRYYEAERRLAI